MNLLVVLAVLGVLAIAVGVGMIYLPAGMIAAGVEVLTGCYIIGYLKAKQQ
jgi:hypothetical protein